MWAFPNKHFYFENLDRSVYTCIASFLKNLFQFSPNNPNDKTQSNNLCIPIFGSNASLPPFSVSWFSFAHIRLYVFNLLFLTYIHSLLYTSFSFPCVPFSNFHSKYFTYNTHDLCHLPFYSLFTFTQAVLFTFLICNVHSCHNHFAQITEEKKILRINFCAYSFFFLVRLVEFFLFLRLFTRILNSDDSFHFRI